MAAPKKSKVLEEIKKDLFASDPIIVLAALEKAKKKGDLSLIEPLLVLYRDTDEQQVQTEIDAMLCAMKIEGAEDELLRLLEVEGLEAVRGKILSYIWNNGFQPIDHVDLITKVSIEGDYMTTLEGLTVIENMEGSFEEGKLLEAISDLREFANDNPESDKIPLLRSLYAILEEIDDKNT